MNNIEPLLKLDYLTVILGIFVILIGFKEIASLIIWYKNTFKVKTGTDLEKEKTEKRINKLEEHDRWQYEQICKISDSINGLNKKLDEMEIRDDVKTVATLRLQLYSLHTKFMNQGYVDKSGLKTFTEIGKIYEEAGGNDIFHDKLKPEVMSLPIHDE